MYRLRGHHLLCLLGYRGMGYSEAYAENMTKLHNTLRTEPDTMVEIVFGPDDLCAHFPEGETYHCEDQNVYIRDSAILERLGVKVGEVKSWQTIEEEIAHKVVPGDIPLFCETCPWRSYGVCEEGIEDVREGRGLRPVRA